MEFYHVAEEPVMGGPVAKAGLSFLTNREALNGRLIFHFKAQNESYEQKCCLKG